MAELSWQDAVDLIHPYIIKISTPIGSGTGFLFAYSADKSMRAVATATHLVKHAHEWQQPIRLLHHLSGEEEFLKEEDRAILLDSRLDTAAILFSQSAIQFPETIPRLATRGKRLRQGVNLAWVGFPAVSPQTLCFFSGHTSAYLEEQGVYLVDGVVINGVSGGPAFVTDGEGGIILAGVITAYIPNRATGEPLPGLCMVSDVSQLQMVVVAINTLDEAKEQETPPSMSSSPANSTTTPNA
jgi:hypothetical protein